MTNKRIWHNQALDDTSGNHKGMTRKKQNNLAKNDPEYAAFIKRVIGYRQDPEIIHDTNTTLAPCVVRHIREGKDTWDAFDVRVQEYIATSKRCAARQYSAQDMHERVWDLLQKPPPPPRVILTREQARAIADEYRD